MHFTRALISHCDLLSGRTYKSKCNQHYFSERKPCVAINTFLNAKLNTQILVETAGSGHIIHFEMIEVYSTLH